MEGAHKAGFAAHGKCKALIGLDMKPLPNSQISEVLLTELSSVRSSPILRAILGLPFFKMNLYCSWFIDMLIDWFVIIIIIATGLFYVLKTESYCTVQSGLKLTI